MLLASNLKDLLPLGQSSITNTIRRKARGFRVRTFGQTFVVMNFISFDMLLREPQLLMMGSGFLSFGKNLC